MIMTGDDLEKIAKRLGPYTLHAGECMIQWVEDGADGQRALLLFNEDKHPFRDFVIGDNGKQHKRVVHAIFIALDEHGHPINQQREQQFRNMEPKGGKYCAAFHILKSDVVFHRYLYSLGYKELGAMAPEDRVEFAENLLRGKVLKDVSSKELDHNHELQAKFRQLFLRPFNEWKEQRGDGKNE